MSSDLLRLSAREQVRRLGELIEQAGLATRRMEPMATVSTGCPPLDRLLPERGFRRGALVEWLSDPPGAGAAALALVAAREAAGEGGALVVIDRGQTFYPPAAAAWRLDLANMILVHPASETDELWALDQALRCEHVAAVLAWPRRLEGRAFRRLQLAAEISGALGLLVRPLAAEREPSWADVRLVASPRPATGGWRLNLRLLRWRGGLAPTREPSSEGGQAPFAPKTTPIEPHPGRFPEVDIEIDDPTGEIHEARPGDLAAELVCPTARREQA